MRVAWVLLLLCGCTAIFDLRAAPNGDRDADGTADETDNCPDIYNPDQSNFDADESGDACDQCIATAPDEDDDGIPDPCDGCVGNGIDLDMDNIDDNCTCIPMGDDEDVDGVDDNCDPCLLGPQHDEDSDGVMDACDNCPGISNIDQANTGSIPDVAGDACDPSDKASTRVFDNFKADNGAWFQFGSGWTREDGYYRVDSVVLSRRGLGLTAGPFRVFTRATLPPLGGLVSSAVELYAGNASVPLQFAISCRVNDEGVLHLYMQSPTGTFDVDAAGTLTSGIPFTLELDVHPKRTEARCTAYDKDSKLEAYGQLDISQTSYPGIAAQGHAEIMFYDLVDDIQ